MQHRVHRSGPAAAASLALAALLVPFVLANCVPGGPSGPEDRQEEDPPATPLTGSVLATIETVGVDAPDSLDVALDDAQPRTVPASGVVTWSDVTPGIHLVTLGGVPANCSLAGTNPKQVTVQAGLQVATAFEVACAATVGELRITVATTGDDVDRDGYRIEVAEAGVDERVETNATLLLTDLPPGEYDVRLRDVDRDCEVADGDHVEAQVSAGERTEVSFEVDCDD